MHAVSRTLALAALAMAPLSLAAGGQNPPAASTPAQLLAQAAERPAPAGHERRFMAWLRAQLPSPAPASDNLQNLIYRFGPAAAAPGAGATGTDAAAPLLIVTEVDQPDTLVSRILPDGNLRLRFERNRAPLPAGYAQYLFAAPLEVLRPGRAGGGWSPLAAAGYGPSIHLMTRAGFRRLDRRLGLDRLYVTTGAGSRAAALRAGVRLLQPVILQPQLFAAAQSPDWFGTLLSSRVMLPAAAQLLAALAAHPPRRPVVVAFATQGWFGHAGLRRLLLELQPAQVIYLGVNGGSYLTAAANQADWGRAWGERTAMPVAMTIAPAIDHGVGFVLGTTPSLALDFPIRHLYTGAEMANLNTLRLFSRSVRQFVLQQAGAAAPARRTGGVVARPGQIPANWRLPQPIVFPAKTPDLAWPARRQLQPSPAVVAPLLERVVQVSAVSQHEGPMRREVKHILARVAPRVEVHPGPDGTLWLAFGPATGPALLFIAHMDEIGWVVNGILPGGTLALEPQGGFLPQLYVHRILLVHTAGGVVPGALRYLPARGRRRPLARLDVGLDGAALRASGVRLGDFVTVPKRYQALLGGRASARSLDDRVGCAALLAAIRQLAAGPRLRRRVLFAFSTGEELGLDGARALARQWQGREPAAVFALDTFVSSDSPLESKRFADARLGGGFVVRAADNSLIAPQAMVDRILRLARAAGIPAQYGATGGGNDASAFIPYGSAGIGLGWPMASSHSQAELSDLGDVSALARIVVTIARQWPVH